MNLTISVDDVGWQGGSDLSSIGGPFRMGMAARDPVLADYEEMVRIGQGAGTRIMTLWILSELDRSGICAKPQYNKPIAPCNVTEFGMGWDNSQYLTFRTSQSGY